ncbi:MAG: hydroxylase [Candidatus Rokuibacteriota bacterium]|nr:MAG: hydroxylase [Candidatus Rokubacteria bacterium]
MGARGGGRRLVAPPAPTAGRGGGRRHAGGARAALSPCPAGADATPASRRGHAARREALLAGPARPRGRARTDHPHAAGGAAGGATVTSADRYDVVVAGGGPAGSATGAFLALAGRRVLVVEREPFPRFHVGESLLPATLPILDRLGVHKAIAERGFQVKYGATFHDQESGLEHTFYFLRDKPWPSYAYQVPRAEFDALLLEHAKKLGVDVRQPATVQAVAFDADGVTVTAESHGQRTPVRARFLVDATGRAGLLSQTVGERERIPNLGKVAIFAHWQGAWRAPAPDEGNIRIYVFEHGWFWWIPLAADRTSVGCVMHARTVHDWGGMRDALYAEMIRRCQRVAEGLAGARQVTAVHSEANFSYRNRPVVGDRFLVVGDAIAFVDPIFSGGVHIALQSGELAARSIDRALADGRFDARRFADYERRVWGGLHPFFRFIHKYYEPAFLELFLQPRTAFGMLDAVLSVLSGGAFLRMSWRTRASLAILFSIARVNVWVRRRAGQPVASRLEW